jgi:hypothetical protein
MSNTIPAPAATRRGSAAADAACQGSPCPPDSVRGARRFPAASPAAGEAAPGLFVRKFPATQLTIKAAWLPTSTEGRRAVECPVWAQTPAWHTLFNCRKRAFSASTSRCSRCLQLRAFTHPRQSVPHRHFKPACLLGFKTQTGIRRTLHTQKKNGCLNPPTKTGTARHRESTYLSSSSSRCFACRSLRSLRASWASVLTWTFVLPRSV